MPSFFQSLINLFTGSRSQTSPEAKAEANALVQQYLAGLQQAYADRNGRQLWGHFEQVKHGAAPENIKALRRSFPRVSETLISLLLYVDGTYHREYAGERLAFYLLGSDVEQYPYYLLSSQEMVENRRLALECFGDYVARRYEGVEIDDRITRNPNRLNWLHFADCINNGGTSQLFIDFSPSPTGTPGQVVRYLHDPDEIKVLADNFEAYLQMLIDGGYDFIQADMLG